jgi:TRAP-type C4-dicarboxylate transport system permease small subunit
VNRALALLRRWDGALARIETGLLALLLFGSLAGALLQIVLRNAAGVALPEIDGLVRRAVLWIALLGASLATHRRAHLAVDLVDQLPAGGRCRRLTRAVTNAAAALVTAVLVVAAVRFVRLESGFAGPAAAAAAAVLPAGFALMAARFALAAWAGLVGAPGGARGDSPLGDAGGDRSTP